MSRDPFQAFDAEARAVLEACLDEADHASLAYLDPATGGPAVSRIALAVTEDHVPLSVLSALAPHAAALRADPRCALLVARPYSKGDPMAHARASLTCRAVFEEDRGGTLRARIISTRPKTRLYIDLPDFSIVRFAVTGGSLNAGFGRAYRLPPAT